MLIKGLYTSKALKLLDLPEVVLFKNNCIKSYLSLKKVPWIWNENSL